jgi:ribosomal protein S20
MRQRAWHLSSHARLSSQTGKGVLKKNTAARRKSLIARARLSLLPAAAAPATA